MDRDNRRKLPGSSELFKKHFGDTCAAGLKHPNMEAFFSELNDVCREEDRRRKKASQKHDFH